MTEQINQDIKKSDKAKTKTKNKKNKMDIKTKNKIYYGQYSLKHWIDLVLSGNIILPKYQRSFRWKKEDITDLILSFNNNLFVPPIIVGAQKKENEHKNFILDGQQRLTSILLAVLGVYPKVEKFIDEVSTNSNDSDDNEYNEVIKWKFDYLLKLGNTIEQIKSRIDWGKYEEFKITSDIVLDDQFLENNYLGFCYLVPDIKNKDELTQNKYYAEVFRNINIGGIELQYQESREALYHLDETLIDFFKPKSIYNHYVRTQSGKQNADFIRYISFLTQFENAKRTPNGDSKSTLSEDEALDKLGKKLNTNMQSSLEKFYEKYIYFIVTKGDKYSDIFGDYKLINGKESLNSLDDNVRKILDNKEEFTSIIDADIYLFGLVYISVIQNKSLKNLDTSELVKKLKEKCSKLKENSRYQQSPNSQKRLRERIKQSIDIYSNFIQKKETNNEKS